MSSVQCNTHFKAWLEVLIHTMCCQVERPDLHCPQRAFFLYWHQVPTHTSNQCDPNWGALYSLTTFMEKISDLYRCSCFIFWGAAVSSIFIYKKRLNHVSLFWNPHIILPETWRVSKCFVKQADRKWVTLATTCEYFQHPSVSVPRHWKCSGASCSHWLMTHSALKLYLP